MTKKIGFSIVVLVFFVISIILLIKIENKNFFDNKFNNANVRDTQTSLSIGFNQVQVATGLINPTAFAFAPDGRIFIALQGGDVRIIKNGSLLATPFLSLPGIDISGERGLNGIAIDPNFNSNHYVYVYYTYTTTPGVLLNNRVSRFTANGDISTGIETVILNLDNLNPATPYHNGGALAFGTDGKLYIGTGDNGSGYNSLDPDKNLGKILRINKDGTIPSSNPFTSGTNQHKQTWALGMRNPFTIAVQPITGKIFANDVGSNAKEEINDITTGGDNFGWYLCEGPCSPSNVLYKDPLYSYAHGWNTPSIGCAITGGTFFNPTTTDYPPQYIGKYFFFDYCGNWMDFIDPTLATPVTTNFMTGLTASPTNLTVGPDGNMYFLSRGVNGSGVGELYKITYTTSGLPVITVQPQSISTPAGNTTSFSVTATGDTPLTYKWRKNGTNISGANSSTYTIPNTQPNNAGNYSVKVTNALGNVISANATLTVTAPNQAPVATITTPVTGATYAGGDLVSFSGTATDVEDGNLPASAYTWNIDFFHNDTGEHSHHYATIPGNTNGSIVIPNDITVEKSINVWYRISLTVIDSGGVQNTTFVDVLPRISNITIQTVPAGNQVLVDGLNHTAPYVFSSVEGLIRPIDVVVPNGFVFSSWSNGGSKSQTITVPPGNTTYTANLIAGTIDVVKPIVTLDLPVNNQVLSGKYTLKATATDNVGVTKVVFYRGTTNMGNDTTSPYTYSWNTVNVPNGTYVLKAKAYDAAGNIGVSSTVTVTVNNPVPNNLAPIVFAGNDNSASGLNFPATIPTFGATATDDGLPNPPNALTLTWSKVSGPGNVTFSGNTAVTNATYSAPGVYVLRLTASDGTLSSYDEVQENIF